MTTTPHIVVLGAGYTGLTAAKLVAKRSGATVTLINERDRFVERMRNHQLASGQQLRGRPLSELLRGTGIALVVDRVAAVDPERRRIELTSGADAIRYDLLINALGSHTDLGAVPGAADHADAVGTAEQAQRLRERVAGASSIAVVGAGLTGLEVASELAETHPDRTVRLIASGALGEGLSDRGREHLHRAFDRLGVDVVEHASVAKVGADGLLLDSGEHIAADAVAWTAGFTPSPLASRAGLAVDDRGRMLVDETLRSRSHPEVYGIGDVAAARNQDGQLLRMGCGPGGITGVTAALAVADRLAGKTPAPLRFHYTAVCISLGRRDGLIQLTERDESPRDRILAGRPAALVKEGIVRGAAWGQRHPALAERSARLF